MEYYSDKNVILYNGKMQEVLPKFIKDNSIDSIVTDPPYELNFMNKGWDNSGVAFQKETWEHCYRVLKEGGYLLAFGGSRTYHRIAVAIEDAGFEIRDTIMWLYGSGFPKSMNIGNKLEQYKGWGTCLKPAFEPIIVARKPFKGSLVDNVIANGVGGLNIDECRVAFEDTPNPATNPLYRKQANYKLPEKGQKSDGVVNFTSSKNEVNDLGRFPANVILTYDENDFDEVCGGFPYSKSNGGKTSMPDLRDVGKKSKESIGIDKLSFGQVSNAVRKESEYIAPCDSGSASRYFYCAKASKKDRDEGLAAFKEQQTTDGNIRSNSETGRVFGANSSLRKNIHPTVKPTDLMQYLVRLVTPANGIILDPFMGSGSTGKAVMYENNEKNKNYSFIGVEMTNEYLPIAKARIYYAQYGKVLDKQEKKQETQQLTLFDFIKE